MADVKLLRANVEVLRRVLNKNTASQEKFNRRVVKGLKMK
jgi:hypothetical protein